MIIFNTSYFLELIKDTFYWLFYFKISNYAFTIIATVIILTITSDFVRVRSLYLKFNFTIIVLFGENSYQYLIN